MGLFGNFFNTSDDNTAFGTTASRENLKQQLALNLSRRGFTEMEVNEVLDVITLAEADIRIAEDSLNHVNINNPDPTRSMHAAIEDIRRYQKELAYNLRKKIIDILKRKQAMKRF